MPVISLVADSRAIFIPIPMLPFGACALRRAMGGVWRRRRSDPPLSSLPQRAALHVDRRVLARGSWSAAVERRTGSAGGLHDPKRATGGGRPLRPAPATAANAPVQAGPPDAERSLLAELITAMARGSKGGAFRLAVLEHMVGPAAWAFSESHPRLTSESEGAGKPGPHLRGVTIEGVSRRHFQRPRSGSSTRTGCSRPGEDCSSSPPTPGDGSTRRILGAPRCIPRDTRAHSRCMSCTAHPAVPGQGHLDGTSLET